MLEYFLSFVDQQKLIRKDEQILLAVSGGIDSMVMAHLFLESPYAFAVSHINFGLRGAESNRDELMVKEWCAKHEIRCFVQHAPKEIFEGKESTQMAARDFRYRYFDELMQKEGFHKLATAHHLDDSLETVLFNFSKGTGLRGLRGINPISRDIIRPMLFSDKEEILKYAEKAKIQWREDASNDSDTYQRNKIRHHVVPVLKTINPGLMRSFSGVTDRVNDAQSLIEEIAENILKAHKCSDAGIVRIDLKWINQYRNPSAILNEILWKYGFSFLQVSQIQSSIVAGVSGKLFYSDLYELNLDRDQFIIREKESFFYEDAKLRIPGITIIGNKWIDADVVVGNEIEDPSDQCVAYLDLKKLSKLTITHWEEGDTFYPLGMKGKKKVSDFMIDSKIPLTLKKDVLILKSEGEIAWIVGYRIDDRFKVTRETQKMLRLQLHSDV